MGEARRAALLVSVQNPSGITMENMLVGHADLGTQNNAVDIAQTWTTGTSSMTYDGIYVFGKYQNAPTVKGLQLSGLSNSCTTILNMMEGNSYGYSIPRTQRPSPDITYEGDITVDDTASSTQDSCRNSDSFEHQQHLRGLHAG